MRAEGVTTDGRGQHPSFGWALLLGLALVPAPLRAASLEDTLGRNETRVLSAPVPVPQGRTVEELALDERLERLGYRRVHERPTRPGEYFHGHDRYWIYRRPCRADGRDHEAELIGLALERGERAHPRPLPGREGAAAARATRTSSGSSRSCSRSRWPGIGRSGSSSSSPSCRSGSGGRCSRPRTRASSSTAGSTCAPSPAPRLRNLLERRVVEGGQHDHPAAHQEPRPLAPAQPRPQGSPRRCARASSRTSTARRRSSRPTSTRVYLGQRQGARDPRPRHRGAGLLLAAGRRAQPGRGSGPRGDDPGPEPAVAAR